MPWHIGKMGHSAFHLKFPPTDHTIMANHPLRNKSMSLKAKKLLSLMLLLPEDWDYTTHGLCAGTVLPAHRGTHSARSAIP
jgi:hypothetical protein